MKKYLLFAGETYYPQKGWDDLWGDYDTIEEAESASERICAAKDDNGYSLCYDWWHIIDPVSGDEVSRGDVDPYKKE